MWADVRLVYFERDRLLSSVSGSQVYILGSPLFKRATIRLDPKWHRGSSFVVLAKNNSAENCYVQSARLNGRELARAWITHEEIVSGGTVEFTMGPKPNMGWGAGPDALPPDASKPKLESEEDGRVYG